MLTANLTSNGEFSVPGGYPFSLTADSSILEGCISKDVTSVVANIAPEYMADVHLAVFAMPASLGGDDGPKVGQADAFSVRASFPVTLTLPVSPGYYVVRLWCSNMTKGGVSILSFFTE